MPIAPDKPTPTTPPRHLTALEPGAGLADTDEPDAGFLDRHVGPDRDAQRDMLGRLGCDSLDQLVEQTIPADIRLKRPLRLTGLDRPLREHEALDRLEALAQRNRVRTSLIGMGYHGTITPAVIRRNVLENPLWYTPYTPYQAEIAQGRLEALLNFQTVIADLTALAVANASLLDEATAAAEAMAMCHGIARHKRGVFLIDRLCHPQTIAVCRTRAESLGIELRVVDADEPASLGLDQTVSGVLVQYPTTEGAIRDYAELCAAAHEAGALVAAATDLLALTLLDPPGEWGGGGADIAVGSAQRFGVPMGFGGPHAAFLATTDKHARKVPGRIIGVSRDAHGKLAYRMAIQTREQHIKRERATSNICTAQALLANIAGFYAVWHGPDGLRRVARRVHGLTRTLAEGCRRAFERTGSPARILHDEFFDTITFELESRDRVTDTIERARERGLNLRDFGDRRVGVSLDETTTIETVRTIWRAVGGEFTEAEEAEIVAAAEGASVESRTTPFLENPVFHRYQSEHELLRYITRLQRKDISLADSMIPLGSCTMKLNAAAEMLPITWPAFAALHPYAPADQWRGYAELFEQLEFWLGEITGLPAVSLQPNAGSQGEYAGLLAIRAYHADRGESHRDVCLIPTSAHGTNPASAVIAGMRIVAVQCDDHGNIDLGDLRTKADQHADDLAAIMVTYPSTHGVFEPSIRELCRIIHDHGGQVYLDGANMNAQVGLCRPGDYGADVCHLNLHKTFCIPHGGGGPGVGPICAAEHLRPYLPGDPLAPTDTAGDSDSRQSSIANRQSPVGPVAAAPYGSASILPISWMYIVMMGEPGLRHASEVAILNANYMAHRLAEHYDVLFRGDRGRVAHEFILDCRPFEKSAGVRGIDIARRLMDYGFHAPTQDWPVPGTLMIEPTESESRDELDRFCDALIAIRREIADIEAGTLDRDDNPLRHAPHTAEAVTADDWPHAYSRERAAYPLPWVRERKFWPSVGPIDHVAGDRHLICTCPSVEDAAAASSPKPHGDR